MTDLTLNVTEGGTWANLQAGYDYESWGAYSNTPVLRLIASGGAPPYIYDSIMPTLPLGFSIATRPSTPYYESFGDLYLESPKTYDNIKNNLIPISVRVTDSAGTSLNVNGFIKILPSSSAFNWKLTVGGSYTMVDVDHPNGARQCMQVMADADYGHIFTLTVDLISAPLGVSVILFDKKPSWLGLTKPDRNINKWIFSTEGKTLPTITKPSQTNRFPFTWWFVDTYSLDGVSTKLIGAPNAFTVCVPRSVA
jgi:hypothetical protein